MQFGRNERSIITQIVEDFFMGGKVDRSAFIVRGANEGFVGWNVIIVIATTAPVDKTGQCGGGEEGNGGMWSIM